MKSAERSKYYVELLPANRTCARDYLVPLSGSVFEGS